MASCFSFSPLQAAQANHDLFLSSPATFSSFQLVATFAKGVSFCIVFFANFALRRFIDDHERGDVSVSLLTLQLSSAFVYLRKFS